MFRCTQFYEARCAPSKYIEGAGGSSHRAAFHDSPVLANW